MSVVDHYWDESGARNGVRRFAEVAQVQYADWPLLLTGLLRGVRQWLQAEAQTRATLLGPGPAALEASPSPTPAVVLAYRDVVDRTRGVAAARAVGRRLTCNRLGSWGGRRGSQERLRCQPRRLGPKGSCLRVRRALDPAAA